MSSRCEHLRAKMLRRLRVCRGLDPQHRFVVDPEKLLYSNPVRYRKPWRDREDELKWHKETLPKILEDLSQDNPLAEPLSDEELKSRMLTWKSVPLKHRWTDPPKMTPDPHITTPPGKKHGDMWTVDGLVYISTPEGPMAIGRCKP